MSRLSVLVLFLLTTLWWAAGKLGQVWPAEQVVIQAGSLGGSFDAYARRYAEHLASRGLRAQVGNQDDSLKIIDKVADATSGVHIGFTSQRVDATRYPAVASAGVIELQPLFLFLRRGPAEPATLAGLVGRRLVMPLEGSATAQATQDVLARYDVTPRNATFSFMKLSEAVAALERGEHDAGFVMLAPDHELVRRLAANPSLVLYSMSDSVGISRNIDYLKPATLARGALDLKLPLPSHDTALIGATVNVVVREDIHPAVLYELLQAMSNVHKGHTLVSDPGEYPRQIGAALPVHPRALEWAKSGTPWLYLHLPPAVAGVVDAYWAPVLALFALVSTLSTLQSVNGLIEAAVLGVALHWLGWLQWRIKRGGRPGWIARMLFRLVEATAVRQGMEQRVCSRLERLRSYMQTG
ncbi:MAG TPA: TAXI family TRAP transporter solute-binding subunit [Ideonella sp.]|uniref:TAXI family TRAP transporter solute-binding subunit n=1 Tax=Ideonella sp. TaxID=1929293 RepID=UPI002E2FE5A4|nr:TAXI family TRAP transporter solute-binding subunit [Ideonella sp.]HEX5683412.1 TAXI family TRAP transporter solute-binding subunit [Ideonella sp.]